MSDTTYAVVCVAITAAFVIWVLAPGRRAVTPWWRRPRR